MAQQLQTMVRQYHSHQEFHAEASRVAPYGWSVAAMTEQAPRSGCLRIILLGPLWAIAFRPKRVLVVTYQRVMVGDESDQAALMAFNPKALREAERRERRERERAPELGPPTARFDGPRDWPRALAALVVGLAAMFIADVPGMLYQAVTGSAMPQFVGRENLAVWFRLITLVAAAVWFYRAFPKEGKMWERVSVFVRQRTSQYAMLVLVAWSVATRLVLLALGSPTP